MTNTSLAGAWSFYPLITSFPPTVLPNIAYWNVTNGTWEYQIQVSWPLNWTSTNALSTVETLYVLDGNAQAQAATESFRRIRPNDPIHPDTIIVSIGYPHLPVDSPYSDGRYRDYQIPVCETCPTPELPGVPSGGEAFLTFLDTTLRPWVHDYFPNAKFNRDALYGHSFSGLFTIWTLISHPHLFDVYLSASPFLIWNNEYIFDHLEPVLSPSRNKTMKPALQLTYGGFEQFPEKRRTETQAAYEERRALLSSLKMQDLCHKLYGKLKDSRMLRHVEIREYPFSYHPAVGGNAIADGLDYFLDW
ncbi:siderophore esteras-like protein IroE-like protein [Ophiobolus disseminans]|uniref:Siderophore esteras-like protein IroE-like protein n=1 Tax=Ophiobolus disseminans TaxID=1469910 RepID=A0A6A7A1U1_9PLEO|nr:siderophore esteras-like protein IroE-like protein [Ophiobolus disseminans]